jgi:hypothetical protein
MDHDPVAFKSWLDAYGHAWESRNPEAATALFTEDGTYQVTPFLEPMRGRKAIYEYWCEVVRTEENITFAYEILVENAERTSLDGQRRLLLFHQDYKRDSMESFSFLLTVKVAANRFRNGGTNSKNDRVANASQMHR